MFIMWRATHEQVAFIGHACWTLTCGACDVLRWTPGGKVVSGLQRSTTHTQTVNPKPFLAKFFRNGAQCSAEEGTPLETGS